MFDHCDSVMKNVIDKKTKMKRQWLINDLLLFIKKYVAVSLYFKLKKKFFMADREFKCTFGHELFFLESKECNDF